MLFAINSADPIPIERDCLENYFSRILEQFDSFHSINIILVEKNTQKIMELRKAEEPVDIQNPKLQYIIKHCKEKGNENENNKD